jgi:exodeoxyribonuclease V alpha subunit
MMRVDESCSNNEILTIQGVVDAVRFSSPESGWACLVVEDASGDKHTVVGTGHGINPGESVSCEGQWTKHAKFGAQFKARSIIPTPPDNTSALEKYLASGAVAGIGQHYAKRLVSVFGDRLPSILDKDARQLEGISGIGPERRKKIAASWQSQHEVRDIMMFLQSHGLGPQRAAQIHRRYGKKAAALITANPYRLSEDFHGIGFTLADETALSFGIGKTDPKRIYAGLREILNKHRLRGDCAAPESTLIKRTARLLSIKRDLVIGELRECLNAGRLRADVINDEHLIYTPQLRTAEIEVADRLYQLTRGRLPWPSFNVENEIHQIELSLGIRLSQSQRRAVVDLATHKVCVITGGPGSGKTTLTKVLIRILAKRVDSIVLCAPTGRAARRLTEATGRDATTIHRLLKGGPGARRFAYNEESPLDVGAVKADEMSMVDIDLTNALLKATPNNAAVIFVGDADQLPSVGPGKVLMDMIHSGVIPVVRLTEIHRQAQNSSIIVNAHRVNNSLLPVTTNDQEEDFHFYPIDDASAIGNKLEELVCDTLPARYGFNPNVDIQVLSPMRKGELGTQALNRRLQDRLNPTHGDYLQLGDTRLSAGDRVVQIINNYEKLVFNGDNGVITAIDKSERTLTAVMEGSEVVYDFDDAHQLMLAYALTVHKSQGSEYKAVVMPVCQEHYILLSKRLLYTGITRGKQLVVLVGQDKALKIAVNSTRGEQRITGLETRLRERFGRA